MSRHCNHGYPADMCLSPECSPTVPPKDRKVFLVDRYGETKAKIPADVLVPHPKQDKATCDIKVSVTPSVHVGSDGVSVTDIKIQISGKGTF